MALSSVSVLKYIWPQIAWAWDSFISFSVQKVLMRLRREKREEERRHPEEQAGGLEELMRLLPQLRGLVENQHRTSTPVQQTSRSATPVTPSSAPRDYTTVDTERAEANN